MKNFLTILTVLGVLISTSAALAKTQGNYIGFDLIHTDVDFKAIETGNSNSDSVKEIKKFPLV